MHISMPPAPFHSASIAYISQSTSNRLSSGIVIRFNVSMHAKFSCVVFDCGLELFVACCGTRHSAAVASPVLQRVIRELV